MSGRVWLATVVAVVVLAAALIVANVARSGGHTSSTGPKAIQAENARRGTRAWQLPIAPAGAIEGYPSDKSVATGEGVNLHVSTNPPARYRVQLYRLGWYGGAGARLLLCLPSCSGDKQGAARPVPPPDASGEVQPAWPVSDKANTDNDWVSGYYMAKLVLTNGPNRGRAASVPFVVRPGRRDHSAVLVQVPVNTWEAYNSWGGKSLYAFNSSDGVPAVRVSFQRPLLEHDVLNFPTTYEYPLVRFLEREGDDVTYQTDVDTHADPASLAQHRLVVTAGHDEYWSKDVRDAFEVAQSQGTNLAFMGGNTGVWLVRYDQSDHTIVAYKEKAAGDPVPEPSLKTSRFRDLRPPRPECELLGVQSSGGLAGPHDPPRNYTVAPAAATNAWFAGTGLSPQTVVPGLVGYEWDTLRSGCRVPTVTPLFEYHGSPSDAQAVTYTASSGARVFSAGAMQFSWGLDNWDRQIPVTPGLQLFVRNLIADLSRPAPAVRAQR